MTPLILVTNDDGIHSPGLAAAVSGLQGLGDLLIVAPSEQQSGMSRSLPAGYDGRIYATQIKVGGVELEAFHLDGSPAQAVLYGVIELAPRKPDLVVSGVNFGENLGSSTGISGTVGAALQGGDMGIRAIAISLETHKDYHYNHGHDVDWRCAAHWLRYFASHALTPNAWPPDVAALKIDLPGNVTATTPWRATTQSRQPYYISHPTRRVSLGQSLRLDYEVGINHETLEPDSDIAAFAIDRVISVTPLSANLTARVALDGFETQLRQPQSALPDEHRTF
ncbi:MAG: 5'/3'-nucleotidase SurE [Caldilineales bacterium]|nr:5'/3'-nucleotidase SurE [Caldilineales bacterium]